MHSRRQQTDIFNVLREGKEQHRILHFTFSKSICQIWRRNKNIKRGKGIYSNKKGFIEKEAYLREMLKAILCTEGHDNIEELTSTKRAKVTGSG
jgi:hypothetical protein